MEQQKNEVTRVSACTWAHHGLLGTTGQLPCWHRTKSSCLLLAPVHHLHTGSLPSLKSITALPAADRLIQDLPTGPSGAQDLFQVQRSCYRCAGPASGAQDPPTGPLGAQDPPTGPSGARWFCVGTKAEGDKG